MKRLLSTTLLTVLCMAVPAWAQPAAPVESAAVPDPKATEGTDGHPCGDFYGAVCDSRKTPDGHVQPAGTSALADRNHSEIKTLLERNEPNPSPAAKRVEDFYASCMDDARLTALGMAPLSAELERIDTLSDRTQLPAVVAHLEEI